MFVIKAVTLMANCHLNTANTAVKTNKQTNEQTKNRNLRVVSAALCCTNAVRNMKGLILNVYPRSY